MFLELAKPASLLASIWALLAVFHAAFLGAETDPRQRLLNALGMTLLAAAVSLAAGLIFTQPVAPHTRPRNTPSNVLPFRRRVRFPGEPVALADSEFQGLIESFPMRIFYWAIGGMAALFLAAWLIETYCIPLSHLR